MEQKKNQNEVVKMEMKKTCKECGNEFVAHHMNQKYCSAKHFRPCPVCGKMVYAKYLSDPARCCSSACRALYGKLNKSNDTQVSPADVAVVEDAAPVVEVIETKPIEMDESSDTELHKKFVGDNQFGFESGKVYLVSISSPQKGEHVVAATRCLTDNTEVDLKYSFTNKKMISKVFKSAV